MSDSLRETLVTLGISRPDSLVAIADHVRDSDKIGVLRCSKSGVILLESSDHATEEVYQKMEGCSYWSSTSLAEARQNGFEDFQRRADLLRPLIANKTWLDFGTGNGGQLCVLRDVAKRILATELQDDVRNALCREGFDVFAHIGDAPSDIDVVSLFHVFEHLFDPIAVLHSIRAKMVPGGCLIVEVPHAGDLLLSAFDHESFKEFTFWSQHLILHTRESLAAFLRAGGFTDVVVEAVQRYPVSNHLYWLAKNLPGGHVTWSFLNSPSLAEAYQDRLSALNLTDTIIAYARA